MIKSLKINLFSKILFHFSLLLYRKAYEEEELEQSDDEETPDEESIEMSKFAEISASAARTTGSSSAGGGGRQQSASESANISASDKKLIEEKVDFMTAYFLTAVIWSIGGVLKQASRDRFTSFFNDLCDNSIGKYPK
jgi:hypothetical protein